eukprot:929031-Karenia_brevis.AAC.1
MPGLPGRLQQVDLMRSVQIHQDMPLVECADSVTRTMASYLLCCTARRIWQIIKCSGTPMNRNYGGCYMLNARRTSN